MADVRGSSRREGRGQLVLVTALSMAVLFVTLALIVNTAIYTENLAMRSSDIGGGTDAVRYQDAAVRSVSGTIEYVNYHNNTDQLSLASNLSAGVRDFEKSSARQFALSDRAVEARLGLVQPGARIAQTEESRNFTNASGTEATWTVAEDVGNVRSFRMHVYIGELATVLSDGFAVVLDDTSNEWTMTVYASGVNEITVDVDGPTTDGTCSVNANDAWINVSDGTFGDESCDVLTTMGDGLTGSYDVRFVNPEDASGTYTFVVDNDDRAFSPDPHLNEEGDGQPFATHAIYSADVEIIYETPRLYYETTVRVAPGEPA